MEREISELIDILKLEYRVYQTYFELLNQQQEHLIRNDLQAIKSSVEKMNVTTQQAVQLEKGRCAAIAKLSRKIEMKPEDITVSRILEKIEGARFSELENLRNRILDIHAKVIDQKDRNALLIGQSMQMVRETVNSISEMNNPKITYDDPLLTKKKSKAILSRTI